MSRLILYHGSASIIEHPVFGKGKAYNDYEKGFYCTGHYPSPMCWPAVWKICWKLLTREDKGNEHQKKSEHITHCHCYLHDRMHGSIDNAAGV